MNIRGCLAIGLSLMILTGLFSSSPLNASWTKLAKLTPEDADAVEEFGWSMVISGDTAVVGAYEKSGHKAIAYIFVRIGSAWKQQARLTAGEDINLDEVDEFDVSVAIDGDTVVLGADGEGNGMGAAYVFVRNGTVWTQQAKLMASDGEANSPLGDLGDFFGDSVSISGDTIAVGAESKGKSEGAAYVFTRSGAAWSQQAKLIARDAMPGDLFGSTVAIRGDLLIVGADGDSDHTGAAYVFTRNGANWSQQAKLTASDGKPGDSLGDSLVFLTLSGDTLITGAASKDGDTGAVYIFERDGSTWSQRAMFTADDADTGALFGGAVAFSANTLVIGSCQADDYRGAAYIFTHEGTSWVQKEKIVNEESIAGSDFTRSAAIDNGTVLLGMPGSPGSGSFSGAAYVYTESVPPSPVQEPSPTPQQPATQLTTTPTTEATPESSQTPSESTPTAEPASESTQTTSATDATPSSTNLGLIIGLAAAAVLVIGMLVYFLQRRKRVN